MTPEEIIEKLKEDLSDAEAEIEGLKEEINLLQYEIVDHECEDNYPQFDLMVDEQKHDLFMEHYSKFTLEQFEDFLKQYKNVHL